MRISDWSSDVCSSDLRNIEFDPALIIGAAAERVVDLAAIVVAGVDHRVERVIGRGIADDARADAANIEAAHLRLTQEEAVGQADLVARRRRAPTERIDITKSEARRGGTECVSTSKFRWVPYD